MVLRVICFDFFRRVFMNLSLTYHELIMTIDTTPVSPSVTEKSFSIYSTVQYGTVCTSSLE